MNVISSLNVSVSRPSAVPGRQDTAHVSCSMVPAGLQSTIARRTSMPLSAPHLTRGGVCTNAGAGSATQTFTSVLPIDLALGIHFGPTECRAIVVSPSPERDGAQVIALASEDFRFVDDEGNELNSGLVWQQALERLVTSFPYEVRLRIESVCVSGSSNTTLLVDVATGDVLAEAKGRDEEQEAAAVEFVAAIAPEGHPARAPTSSLCKLASWHLAGVLDAAKEAGQQPSLMHQSDYVAYLLHNQWSTDWNHAADLGFDAASKAYPEWVLAQEFADCLPPEVYRPGQAIAPVERAVIERLNLHAGCVVHAGTVPSVAEFLSSGLSYPGDALTHLGSRLRVQLLSDVPVAEDVAMGLRCYRLDRSWLVEATSNTGGNVLRQFFDDADIWELSAGIDPENDTELGYYPLSTKGEVFPYFDPEMPPRLDPRPEEDTVFLQGMLEGITEVEIAAYDTFVNMGATPPAGVLTTGGGSANPRWQAMRKRKLGVPVAQGAERDAALGAAILATYKDEVEEGEASLDAAEQLKMAMEALQARASADGSMDEEEEVEEGGEEGEAGVEDQAEEVEADDSQTETETETVQK